MLLTDVTRGNITFIFGKFGKCIKCPLTELNPTFNSSDQLNKLCI